MLPLKKKSEKPWKVLFHQLLNLWCKHPINGNLRIFNHFFAIFKLKFIKMNRMLHSMPDPKSLIDHFTLCRPYRLTINDVYSKIANRSTHGSKKQLIRSSSDFEIQGLIRLQQLLFIHIEMDANGLVLLQAANFNGQKTFSVLVKNVEPDSHFAQSAQRRFGLHTGSQVGIRNALLQFCHFMNTLNTSELVLVIYCPPPARSHSMILLNSLRVNGLLDRIEDKVLGFLPMHHLLKKVQPSRKRFAFDYLQKTYLQPPYPIRPLGYMQLFEKKILAAVQLGKVNLNYRSRSLCSEIVMSEIY